MSNQHKADNYWLVIPLTFCENRNLDVLEGALTEKLGYETKKDFAVDTESLINQLKKNPDSSFLINLIDELSDTEDTFHQHAPSACDRPPHQRPPRP